MLKSVIAVNDNITIMTDEGVVIVNRLKNETTYNEVLEKVQANDIAWIEKSLPSIKNALEAKSDGFFAMNKGKVVLKGTDKEVPEAILKKFMELEKEQAPILPLLRFWKKLMQNPNPRSVEQLYTFMQKNNIPITEQGDIVTEKGVVQKVGSFAGDFVDDYTKTIDNSIGSYVVMDRNKVDDNPNNTCSFGLHVAAPEYVRDYYSRGIIVECIVNPKDVVSVPVDYDAKKMRVCAYRVAGYGRSEKRKADKVVKLSDFFLFPTEEQKKRIGNLAKKDELEKPTKAVVAKDVQDEISTKLNKMSAKEIVDMVKLKTGEEITISLKSKKSIVKRAESILTAHNIKTA